MKYPMPRVKKSAAEANMEAKRSFSLKDFFNKKTSVPPAPKPVRARAIAENVKFPKPSTLNTLMSEISRARSDEDVKNSAVKYNSILTFFWVRCLESEKSVLTEQRRNILILNFPCEGDKYHG